MLRWLIGFVIVAFWGGMSFLLVRLVYFPDETRLARESPRMVNERFLSRHLPSNLIIWKGSRRIGSLSVEPKPLTPAERHRLQAFALLRSQGVLFVQFPGQPERRLNLDSTMALSTEAEVRESRLVLRLDDASLLLEITHSVGEASSRVVLKQGETVLLDSKLGASGDSSSEGLMALLLGGVGLDPQELQRQRTAAEKDAAASRSEARKGTFSILGQTFAGYILTTTIGGPDRKFTLHISDSGELLQMTASFLDYQFISEDLGPETATGPAPQKNRGQMRPLPVNP
ncbi:MAG: hypothetical protein KA004_02160 [Verrucomicrobiales bacterium]|nr:hypothetical protein [Verrucomicrobiales bacterium]